MQGGLFLAGSGEASRCMVDGPSTRSALWGGWVVAVRVDVSFCCCEPVITVAAVTVQTHAPLSCASDILRGGRCSERGRRCAGT